MNRYGRIATGIVLALLCGCGRDDGRVRLLVYSPHGPQILEQFEKLFEAARPDVDVVTVYLPTAEIGARVRAEKANPQASLWWGAPAWDLDVANRDGLLEAYRPSYATEELPHHSGWAWTACFELPVVLGYHPGRITKEELPKTFAALADPKYRGRIVLREPMEAGTLRTFVGATIARALAAGGTEDDGFRLLAGIHANVGQYEAKPELMFERLERGPEAITVWNLTDLVFQRQELGYSFLPAGLDEPVPVILDGIALVKGGPAKDAAIAFYEFVNSLESLRILAETHGRIPCRRDFDRRALAAGIREVAWTPMALDPALLGAKMKSWMERFDVEIKGGRKPR